MDQLTFIGASGAFIILVAFVMNQIRKWKESYLIYDLANFIGGSLLVAYAYLLDSYPFLILNGVWGLLSLRDIFVDLKRNSQKRSRNFFTKWSE